MGAREETTRLAREKIRTDKNLTGKAKKYKDVLDKVEVKRGNENVRRGRIIRWINARGI